MGERGQLYTLEGIFAGLIILLGLLFAIQTVSTTPSAAGASNPHAIQDDEVFAQDVLASMDHATLKNATLYWGANGFHCSQTGVDYYTGTWDDSACTAPWTGSYDSDYPPPNPFGAFLEQRLGEQYAYNVRVAHQTPSGSLEYQRMVYQGEPGVGAVRASTSVVLLNDDKLVDPDGTQGAKLSDTSDFYAEPTDTNANDDNAYNVVHIEVIIWRG